jgi:hypothetical protein
MTLTPERLQQLRDMRDHNAQLSEQYPENKVTAIFGGCVSDALTDLLAALDAANARIAALQPDAALGAAVRNLAIGFGIRRAGRDTWARTYNDAPAGVEATPDAALGIGEKAVKG